MRIIKKSLVLEDGCYVNTKLRLQRIPSKGRGVVAVRKIRKGEIIALSGGVVFPAVGLWHLLPVIILNLPVLLISSADNSS